MNDWLNRRMSHGATGLWVITAIALAGSVSALIIGLARAIRYGDARQLGVPLFGAAAFGALAEGFRRQAKLRSDPRRWLPDDVVADLPPPSPGEGARVALVTLRDGRTFDNVRIFEGVVMGRGGFLSFGLPFDARDVATIQLRTTKSLK